MRPEGALGHTLRSIGRFKGTNGGNDARPAHPDDRAWGLRPPYHDGHAPADPPERQAHADHPVRVAEPDRYAAPGLQRPQRGSEAEVRGGERARPVVRHPRARPLPVQRLPPAGRGRLRHPRHSREDPVLRRAGPPRHRRADGRPAQGSDPGHRSHRVRQVHDAGRDGGQGQFRARGAHRHHRRPDRVRTPAQEVHGEPARGVLGHALVQERAEVDPTPGPRRRARR